MLLTRPPTPDPRILRISEGRTGKRPSRTHWVGYGLVPYSFVDFHHVAGTSAPGQHRNFLDGIGSRCSYRVKLSARHRAPSVWRSHRGRPTGLGVLPQSRRGARHRARYRSPPVKYTSRDSSRPVRETRTLLSCYRDDPCYHGICFAFAPAHRQSRQVIMG